MLSRRGFFASLLAAVGLLSLRQPTTAVSADPPSPVRLAPSASPLVYSTYLGDSNFAGNTHPIKSHPTATHSPG